MKQHKKGDKVLITEQAILKVKRVGTKSMTKEEIDKVYEMHKTILQVSRDKNDSNEVAMLLNGDGKILGTQLGDQYSVDVEKNIDFSCIEIFTKKNYNFSP